MSDGAQNTAFDMDAAFDEIEAREAAEAPPVEEVAEEDTTAHERERDEHGRFRAKESEEQPPEGETETPAEPESPVEQPPEAPAYAPAAIRKHWANLDQEVRDAWEKRETDFTGKATQWDGERQYGRSMKAAIDPYLDLIKAEGGEPVSAVRDLLETAKILRQGSPEQKAQMLNVIATRFGCDIEQAYHNRPDPMIAQRDLMIARQNAEIETMRQQQQMVQEDGIAQTIAQFRETHEHFDAVADEMSRLIIGGVCQDLQSAYDRAIWSDDQLRSALIAKQAGEQVLTLRREEEAKQAESVQRARKAAVSPASAPGSSKPTAPSETVDDMYSRLYDEIASSHS